MAAIAIDDRTVIAKLTEPGCDGGRYQRQRANPGAGMRLGLMALFANPLRGEVGHPRAAVVLVGHLDLALRIVGIMGADFRQACVIHRDAKHQHIGNSLLYPSHTHSGSSVAIPTSSTLLPAARCAGRFSAKAFNWALHPTAVFSTLRAAGSASRGPRPALV